MISHAVAHYINVKSLFTFHDKILVTLSGGADSVCLLRILLKLGYTCEAAHCNFSLRGEESQRDELFVRELCETLEVPLHVKCFDTYKYAEDQHISIEMAARELRYRWFESLREETKSNVIAVAHHQDDSVETFLINLIRGAGINGLTGIKPVNGFIVRPLLGISRDEIISYLTEIDQPYVTDSTNLQDDYVRNKIRLNILPLMEQINPSVRNSIATTADRLSEVASIYNDEIKKSIKRVTDKKGIQIDALLKEKTPEMVLFEILYPLGFNSKQVDDICRNITRQSGKVFLSKKWRLIQNRSYLLLEKNDESEGLHDTSIKIDGEGHWAFGKKQFLEVKSHSFNSEFQIPTDKRIACVDIDKLEMPLTLRRWKTGESFIPFGMQGRKKISDYLTDRKLSIVEKENTYVVCSGDIILWVVGERIDNRFRINETTTKVLVIELIETE